MLQILGAEVSIHVNSKLYEQDDSCKSNDATLDQQSEKPSEPEFHELGSDPQPTKRTSKKPLSEGYEVGYGKPPKDTQFRKGASGNPGGRPRKRLPGMQNVGKAFGKVFAKQVPANLGGKSQLIDGMDTALWQLRSQISAGSLPAIKLFFDLCLKFNIGKQEVNEQLKGLFDALMAGPKETPKLDTVDTLSSPEEKIDRANSQEEIGDKPDSSDEKLDKPTLPE